MEVGKKNIKTAVGIITFTVVLVWFLNNTSSFINLYTRIITLVYPFLIGAGIAFILKTPLNAIERMMKKLTEGKKNYTGKEKQNRILSLTLLLVFTVGIVLLVCVAVLPELGNSIAMLVERIPEFFTEIEKQLSSIPFGMIDIEKLIDSFEVDWQNMIQNLLSVVGSGAESVFSSTVSVASSVISGLINIFLGIVFAIYLLFQKEQLSKQVKKVCYALLKENRADNVLRVAKLADQIFSNFLSGQVVEALILGSAFFVTMTVFGLPYALVVSILIAFTALIPIFGAFIGCIVGMFLIAMVNPVQALWFLLLFLVLQQLEGNFIYPRVVGSSVGLPSIWVLVAVTLGGNLMGILGMIIFIPVFSVLYILMRGFVNKRLEIRQIRKQKYDA